MADLHDHRNKVAAIGFNSVERNPRSTDISNSAFSDNNNFARCRKIRIFWIKGWV